MAATELRMPDNPALGRVMLTRWIVPDGSEVRAGDELFEIESNKATIALPAPASGKLQQIARTDRPLLAGQLIGLIHDP